MVRFSEDRDILKYEPVLFGLLHLPSQVLVSGTGGLSGTSFTAGDADFVSAGVSAGNVIALESSDGFFAGTYEVISVDSATQLTVSVLRPSVEDAPIAPPAATDISFRISTFAHQAEDVGFVLTEYFGIAPGNPGSKIEADDILEKEVLRRASVFAIISSTYAILASRSDDEHLWKKSRHYRELFEKAKERCRLDIDTDGDGVPEETRFGGSVRLMRD